MNLIPSKSEHSISYFCTWRSQNILAAEDGRASGRDMMDEQRLFGSDGFVHGFQDVCEDMYLVLDDGWDVDYGVSPDKDAACFGSFEMSEQKFPSVKGLSPAERLRAINLRVKSHGWKGIGLWVAAQRCAPDYDAPFKECDLAYWQQRILWCREAGVEYWKVDWGTHADDVAFRKALTSLAKELYPALIIEHAACMLPLNAPEHPSDELRGRYAGEQHAYAIAREAVDFSQVLRSYDVISALSVPTTLDRLSVLLPLAKGLINGEDECYINAALGCSLGVMRSHYDTEKIQEVGDDLAYRLDEVTAALRWQRIAPPFAGTDLACSKEILFDEQYFAPGSTWYGSVYGKEVRQGAPAVITRNLPLDSVWVEGQEKPYVVASVHPCGAYSVCVQPRTLDGVRSYPEACVHCEIPDGVDTLGVLGVGCDVILHLPRVPEKVYVQSLISDHAFELTEGVQGNTVTITKEFARRVFGSIDRSVPALMMYVEWAD